MIEICKTLLIQILKKDQAKEIIKADNAVIATGSEQRDSPYAKIDDRPILSTKGALEIDEIPNSLVLIGGNMVGIEFAIIYNGFGCDVKILEPGLHLLPSFDSDIRRIQSMRSMYYFLSLIGIKSELVSSSSSSIFPPGHTE